MKIAVIGAGAIGNVICGYLKIKGHNVKLIGRSDSVSTIKEHGLQIRGVRGNFKIELETSTRLHSKPDFVILTTKTQDISAALKQNFKFLESSVILTTQNGIKADGIVSEFVAKENIISSIVMFGATYLEPGKVVHNFEGNWIIGKEFKETDTAILNVSKILSDAFPVAISDNIKAMKYLKVFVNANNCIPAILGKSMQEAMSDYEISRISIAIWKEGLDIVRKSGVNLLSLPDFPLERLEKLVYMPVKEAASIFSGIMANLSKEPVYGSILQSIKRGRASEIDYINGEFVGLAQNNNSHAPLNEKLIEMVHKVEKTGVFFTKEELLDSTRGLLN